MLPFTDLFGMEFTIPTPAHQVAHTRRTIRLKPPRPTPNLELFDIFEYLERPLRPDGQNAPIEDQEVRAVDERLDDDDAAKFAAVDIEYEPWESAWVVDQHGLRWSRAAVVFLQHKLLVRSLEILGLAGYAKDKYDILRWAFAPPFRNVYFTGDHGELVIRKAHQRDEPFSFHNCAIAAAMDADAIRDGLERNLPEVLVRSIRENPNRGEVEDD
jgi:hypothetical protein